MSSPHYLFHVAYYERLGMAGDSPYPKHNEALTQQRYKQSDTKIALTGQSFEMRTLYPGLLLGLGYPHEVGKDIDLINADDAIKLGFFLDYTTGLPFIPGSSVKGMLRSAFRKSWEYIQETAISFGIAGLNGETDVRALETAIFGEWCKDTQAVKENAPGIERRDAFFDAVPVKPDPNGYLLNLESITPHRKAEHGIYIGMKNPTPLKLLKVRPMVHYLFRFKLRDSAIGSDGVIVKAVQKMDLFKRILSDLGAAAKTSVGFGMVEPVKQTQAIGYKELIPAGTTVPAQQQSVKPAPVNRSCNPKGQPGQRNTSTPAEQKSAVEIAFEKANRQKAERERK